MTLTETHKSLLRTALGLNVDADPWRNALCPDLDSTEQATCEDLVAAGMMEQGWRTDGVLVYRATVAGLRAVWGRAAVYELTGDEVTARETEKKIQMYWQGAPRGRFKTGEVYRVGKATVRWL